MGMEKEQSKENKEYSNKLVVGNLPDSMGEGLLSTLFSPYGELKNAKIMNECGIIEYSKKEEARKAFEALNGFQIGANKLTITFGTDQISHIMNMPQIENKQEQDDVTDNKQDDIILIEKPLNGNKPLQKISIFEEQEIEKVEKEEKNEKKEEYDPQLFRLNMEENDKETPNEDDIEQLVNKEEFEQIIHDEVEK